MGSGFSRHVLAAFAFLAFAVPACAQDWSRIRIGIDGSYPPFSELDENGQPEGFDIDIARALCREMQAECTLHWNRNGTWQLLPRWLLGVLEEPGPDDIGIELETVTKVDAVVASMAITEERKRVMAFTDKYYETPLAVVVKQSLYGKVKTGEDFRNLRIGAIAGSPDALYVEKYFAGAELRAFDSAEEVQAGLQQGRVAVAVGDGLDLIPFARSAAGQACCRLAGTVERDRELYGDGYGIAVRKEDTALLAKFNRALAAIRSNGTFDSIAAKYFTFDVKGD